jgi:hypothetical protein
MEHTKHIIRAVLLVVLAVVVFVVVRHFAIPETFGTQGHYRYENVAEHAAKAPVHGPVGACADCHDEEAAAVADGKHSSVPCAVCHAALSLSEDPHVRDGEMVGSMPVHRDFTLCRRCHERLVSRPPDFPQVVLPDHVVDGGMKLTGAVCLECHNAHNPSE